MNLNQYEAKFNEIKNATDLTDDEKANALDVLATEIEGCVWQSHAKERARSLAQTIRAAMPTAPTLAGLDSLAARGAISPRR